MSNIICFKNSLSSGPPLQAQSRILMGPFAFCKAHGIVPICETTAADNGENPHELRQLTASSDKTYSSAVMQITQGVPLLNILIRDTLAFMRFARFIYAS